MKNKTILLVDDVRLFLEVEKSYLDRGECQVVVAQSGAEALKIARVLNPDLVIMDVEMPDMDGIACCRELRNLPQLKGLPVILLTDNKPGNAERCRAAGCDEVLVRPFHRRALLEAAQRFLSIDGRAVPRARARLLVRYGVENQLELHDYTINLSNGGLFLETEKILPIETPLTLEFIVPGSDEALLCKGRVAWVNQGGTFSHKPDLPGGFGVAFLDLSPGDLERLTGYMQHELDVP